MNQSLFIIHIQIKMKYHEKLNLTSPIYKYNGTSSKTPLKSPIKAALNPSELFQKVCCPNCKYAFKIIKQQILKETLVQTPSPLHRKETLVQTPSPLHRTTKKQQKYTQTQGVLTLNNSNSPVKVLTSQTKLSFPKDQSGISNSRKSQFNRLNQMLQTQNVQNRYMQDLEYKFKPLSISPDNKKSKSNNLIKTLGTQRIGQNYAVTRQMKKQINKAQKIDQSVKNYSQILYLQDYDHESNRQQKQAMQRSSQTSRKISQKIEANHLQSAAEENQRTASKIQKIGNNKPAENQPLASGQKEQVTSSRKIEVVEPQKKAHPITNNELQLLITGMVLKSQENKSVIRQLQGFCRLVCDQIQVPSYCKMLALIQ